MIIISSRKFRDTQNVILKKAMSEEVILTTLHYGNFRLVPIEEGEDSYHRPNVEVKVVSNYATTPAVSKNEIEHESTAATPGRKIEKPESRSRRKYEETVPDTKEKVEISAALNSEKKTDNNKENVDTSWATKPRQNEDFEKAFNESQENKESSNTGEYSVRTSESNGNTIIIEERIEPETNRVFEPFTPPAITKKPTRVIVDGSIEPWELEQDQNRGGEIFVDPSLLSLEDALKQQGLEPEKPKKGFFGRLFGKKK